MRVESSHPHTDGGWYHDKDGQEPKKERKAKEEKKAIVNTTDWHAVAFHAGCLDSTGAQSLAPKLGVSVDSLIRLHTGEQIKRWLFPMWDENREIIGIRIRDFSGNKYAMSGSRNGMFYPDDVDGRIAMVCEGPTSAAAAWDLGFFPIGRAFCSGSIDQTRLLVKRLKIRQAIIAADNDDRWNEKVGRQLSPGMDGANKLSERIGIKHAIWVPPVKDVRQFLLEGGTHEMIMSSVGQTVWRQ